MSSTTTKRPTQVSWKRLLTEAKELMGQSGLKAHRRATILCQLFDDADFRADVAASDDFKTEQFLNELLEDLCIKFADVRLMLAEFPGEEAWADGKLATLHGKAIEQAASRNVKEKPETQRTVNRVTREQYEAVQDEVKDREARISFIEKQLTQAVTSATDLERENRELRLENERLKGRIEQLEAMMNRRAA